MKIKTKYWYWIWKTFLGPSRLRKKFVRVFLLAGLIPLLLMGAISIYLVNLTHQIDVEALERNIARQVSTEVKKIVDEAISVIELTVAFEDFAPISFIQQDFILESILKDNVSLSDISFVCLTPRNCTVGRETKRWTKTDNGIKSNQLLRNIGNENNFLTAKDGKNYFGEVEIKEGIPEISIASPVYNKNSQVISVLIARMNLSSVQDIVKNTKLGDTGYVYITNKDGKIISHRQENFIGEEATQFPPVQFLMNNKELSESLGETYDNLTGQSVTGSGDTISDLNWIVVAEWPQSETQDLIVTIFWQIGIFSVITLILIVIIASWVAFRLIQPIAKLKQGTSVIGGGNFDYRVDIKTGDELEDLGKSVNKMAENLKGIEEVRELRIRTESLQESLRKEQELSKVKDQFITTISHQLNTPLSVIKWALSELSDPEVKPERIKESVKIIAKSQQDIASIVNDLVTLSEVGFSYEKTKTKKADFAEVVKKSIETFRDALKLRNISLNFKNVAQSTAVEINEFTIQKAIENLIDNAIGYSNEGGQIYIELSGNDKELIFKITDEGIGIPKEDHSSIFEQFFRARNAVAKKNVGTGLGLFIAKNIVEGHKGKISFKSQENRGSTFFISLPK